jgi:hypothetical protein
MFFYLLKCSILWDWFFSRWGKIYIKLSDVLLWMPELCLQEREFLKFVFCKSVEMYVMYLLFISLEGFKGGHQAGFQ